MRYILLIIVLLMSSPTQAGVVFDLTSIPNIIQQVTNMAKEKILNIDIVNSQTKTNKEKGDPATTKTTVDHPETQGKGEENYAYTNCPQLQKALENKRIETSSLYGIVKKCYSIASDTIYNSSKTPMNAQVNVSTASSFNSNDTVSVDVHQDASTKNSVEAIQQQAHVTAEAARALASKTHDDIRNNKTSEFQKARSRLDGAKNIAAYKKIVIDIKHKIALEIHKAGVLSSNSLAIKSTQKLQSLDYKNEPKSSKSGS